MCARFGPRSETFLGKEREESEKARSKTHEFRDWFIAEFGGVTCRDAQIWLLGRSFSLMDEEERQAKREFHAAVGRKCSEIMTKTALKVAEIMSQEDTG